MTDPVAVMREALQTAKQSGVVRLNHYLKEDEFLAAKREMRKLWLLSEVAVVLNRWFPDAATLRAPAAGKAGPLRFLAGSLFLEEIARYLVRDSCEDIAYVTGVEVAGVFVLSQMLTFATEHRSAVAVRGDFRASSDRLIELETRGHRLLGWVHSHPGSGSWATLPSPTDLAHQQRLEHGGYPAVGIIVARDGHVRFFSKGLAFTIDVYGKGVTRHDDRQFSLDFRQPRN